MNSLKRLRLSILAVILLVLIGTLGYHRLEGWSLLDSVYMTVRTLATIGEAGNLDARGKMFTMLLAVVGITGIAIAFGSLVDLLVTEEIRQTFRRKKMDRQIASYRNHYIVCGYGRMGQQIVRDFLAAKAHFVVVETNPEQLPKLEAHDVPHIVGDASDDETLISAGVKHAKGLIAVAPTDADNIYISLTARTLNPEIFIVARAMHEETQEKISRAGANQVISPYVIGGRRMAAAILRPNVIDLMDTEVAREHLELQLSELTVAPECQLVGQSLRQSRIRSRTGAMVVAIKTRKKYVVAPDSDTIIEAGSVLIAAGNAKHIESLRTLCGAG